jgi:spoIIIJ-associated protein
MKDSEIVKFSEETIKRILDLLQFETEVKVSVEPDEEDKRIVKINITGDDLGYLIGYKGSCLNSLQMIFGQILSKKIGEMQTVLIDVNDYREKRKQYLTSLAQRASEEARESGQSVALPPQSPFERRIVHMALKEEDGVTTESEGEGFDRHVVIKLK